MYTSMYMYVCEHRKARRKYTEILPVVSLHYSIICFLTFLFVLYFGSPWIHICFHGIRKENKNNVWNRQKNVLREHPVQNAYAEGRRQVQKWRLAHSPAVRQVSTSWARQSSFHQTRQPHYRYCVWKFQMTSFNSGWKQSSWVLECTSVWEQQQIKRTLNFISHALALVFKIKNRADIPSLAGMGFTMELRPNSLINRQNIGLILGEVIFCSCPSSQFFHSLICYLCDFNKWKDYVCSFIIIGYMLPLTYKDSMIFRNHNRPWPINSISQWQKSLDQSGCWWRELMCSVTISFWALNWPVSVPDTALTKMGFIIFH